MFGLVSGGAVSIFSNAAAGAAKCPAVQVLVSVPVAARAGGFSSKTTPNTAAEHEEIPKYHKIALKSSTATHTAVYKYK